MKKPFEKISKLLLVIATCFLILEKPNTACAQKSLAIKGGYVITIAGEPIENGTVLIQDGKITGVGADLKIPLEATVVDATGKIVMPGFVEAHSSEGMSQANETNPNVPYVSVLDSVDPMRSYFDEARRNGVTSVAVVPGNSTMIGGQAAVIKTGGTFLDNMILKRDAGIKISLRPVGSGSRMSHLAALRKELDQIKQPEEATKKEADKEEDADAGEKKEEDSGEKTSTASRSSRPDTSNQTALKQAMTRLLNGELTAFIYCDNATDVAHAVKLADDYGLKPVLVVDKNCHTAVDKIAESGYPVVLDSELVFWDSDPRTGEEEKVVLTKLFDQHEIPYAFQKTRANSNTVGSNYLWYQAATAVRYGKSKEAALTALTLQPAEFLGVDRFVGSIEVGKDGDLIILSGDPLKVDTWIEKTIVNGEVVYDKNKDEKLKNLLGTSAEN